MSVLSSQDAEESRAQMDSCEDFNIITLNDNSVHEISCRVQENGVLEIGLTIMYR